MKAITPSQAGAALGRVSSPSKSAAARANGARGGRPVVRYRTTSAHEDTAEFANLLEAMASCRDGETVTVVAYRPGEGSPFWAAAETFRQ